MNDKHSSKISDNAFDRFALTAVLGILACIICLCSTTYAWYTATISGGKNEIVASGECLLEISVSSGTESVEIVDGRATLQRGVQYTVTLSLPKDSPSGYCVITTDSGVYYTDYLGRHQNDTPSILTFVLSIPEQGTPESLTVGFETRWGIYSGDVQVTDGGNLEIE